MKFIEKVKNLVTPGKWIQGFMLTKFGKRMGQFGAAALAGVIASPKIAEFLSKYGVTFSLDKEVLGEAIAVALVALLGGVFNTAKHGPLKDK